MRLPRLRRRRWQACQTSRTSLPDSGSCLATSWRRSQPQRADWPETPEIWYGGIMQECFWALVSGEPPDHAEHDERSAAEGLAIGVLLAMTSMDRHGHGAAAYLCEIALAYLATLPAWRDVGISFNAPQDPASVVTDLTSFDWMTYLRSGQSHNQ